MAGQQDSTKNNESEKKNDISSAEQSHQKKPFGGLQKVEIPLASVFASSASEW
jgi:hypothetical protein